MDSRPIASLLEYNRIPFEILHAEVPGFWERIVGSGLFIFQWTHHDHFRQIARAVLPVVEEHLGVRCFPSGLASWVYDDKVREYYLLKAYGFPIAESWVFYSRNNALAFLEHAKFPIVFKLRNGAGSKMIVLLKGRNEAERLVRRLFGQGVSYAAGLPGAFRNEIRESGAFRAFRKRLGRLRRRISAGTDYMAEDWSIHQNYILLQRFFPGNDYDTRVAIIGNRAFAFRRINRAGDFRASGSAKVRMDPEGIDFRFLEIAFRVSRTLGFNVMAFDFMYDEERKPVIGEISYVFGSRRGSHVSDCPGHWDESLRWHPGRIPASYAILSELLERSDLRRLPESVR